MSEETNDVVAENQYDKAINNELKVEYEELKASYKSARRNAKTQDERKMLMRMYQDDLIELAIHTRIAGNTDFNAALNQEIDGLKRRLWTGGSRNW